MKNWHCKFANGCAITLYKTNHSTALERAYRYAGEFGCALLSLRCEGWDL